MSWYPVVAYIGKIPSIGYFLMIDFYYFISMIKPKAIIFKLSHSLCPAFGNEIVLVFNMSLRALI